MKDNRVFVTHSDRLGIRQAIQETITQLMNNVGFGARERRPRRQLHLLESLEELLQRDKKRQEDGFPSKIKFRRILVGHDRIIAIPYVEEEKLIHGEFEEDLRHITEETEEEVRIFPGHGEGEVGDIIGKIPLSGGEGGEEGEGEEGEPRAGLGSGEHGGLEEQAYQLGQELIEKFELPNLKDKGKKVPTDDYQYDLTNRHEGTGQILDEDETLERIIETNLLLRRIKKGNIDLAKLVVSSDDEVYRVLSREHVWKSQAVVFFLRDYSGSMWGEPTATIVTQHLMIYAWLLLQYEKLVIPRFIVHDTEAKEVSPEQYFKESAGGGTFIPSAYKKVNEIVESEGLVRDYNIYVFQGTDGEDFDDGTDAIPEIEKILGYVNRMGVCVLKNPYYVTSQTKSRFEEYVEGAGFPEQRDLFRMYVLSTRDVTEEQQIEAMKALISQE